jgi:hypothetical protein
VTICNVGDCDLHVSSVAFEHKRRGFRLLHNPFPATVHPGAGLDVVIRYWASGRPRRPCELVIKSDDPVTPHRELEVIAWTRREDDDDHAEHGDEEHRDER